MPDEVEPAELDRLLDFAERPRVDDWSLRAALVRYAQPEPERAAQILELVRRIGTALSQEANGSAEVTGLLEAVAEMDRLGDRLATWAVDRAGERPDNDVDEVIADVTGRLDGLGIPREESNRPPRSRR